MTLLLRLNLSSVPVVLAAVAALQVSAASVVLVESLALTISATSTTATYPFFTSPYDIVLV